MPSKTALGVENLRSYRLAPGFNLASDIEAKKDLYHLLAFLLTGLFVGSAGGAVSLFSRQLKSPKIRREIRQHLEAASPNVDLDISKQACDSGHEKTASASLHNFIPSFLAPSMRALGPLMMILGAYGSYSTLRDLVKWKVEADSNDEMLAAAKRYDAALRRLMEEKMKAEKQASHRKEAFSLSSAVDFYWSLVAATFGLAAILTHIKTKNQGAMDVLKETLRSRTLSEFESSPPSVAADAPGVALSTETRKERLL